MSTPIIKSGFGFAAHKDSERWDGLFATREEAIAEAVATYGMDVGQVWICTGEVQDVSAYFGHYHVQSMLESITDSACDEVGDAAEDWPSVSNEAVEELMEYIKSWLTKHSPHAFWEGGYNPECVHIDADGNEVTP